MKTTYADSWSDMAKPCDMALLVMNWRSAWPIFHGPVILPYILKTTCICCMNIILLDYESACSDIWPHNKVGHCDPYFMVQWFCLISWRLFDVWTSYFGITSPCDPTFDLKINVGHCDLYFMVRWFCLISPRLFDEWVIFSDNETVWPKLWHQNKHRSTWPIFHGLVILLNIFQDYLMDEHHGIMDQCDTKMDIIRYIA